MGFKDFFKRKKTEDIDPLNELTFVNLWVGSYVDWDMNTWEVCTHGITGLDGNS